MGAYDSRVAGMGVLIIRIMEFLEEMFGDRVLGIVRIVLGCAGEGLGLECRCRLNEGMFVALFR